MSRARAIDSRCADRGPMPKGCLMFKQFLISSIIVGLVLGIAVQGVKAVENESRGAVQKSQK